MPRWAHNKMPASVKQRYFELLRQGYKGVAAARAVGVSTSCGSLWFLGAGGMLVPEAGPVSSRFLDQDDRIAIADGLFAGRAVKEIAAAIGKSFQTVYREVKRNSKPDGGYQPWWAHNQALRHRRQTAVAGDHQHRGQAGPRTRRTPPGNRQAQRSARTPHRGTTRHGLARSTQRARRRLPGTNQVKRKSARTKKIFPHLRLQAPAGRKRAGRALLGTGVDASAGIGFVRLE